MSAGLGRDSQAGSMAPRERLLLAVGAALTVGAALWWLAIAPAWATLRDAESRHARLDEQLQHMRTLAQEATQLKTLARVDAAGAQRALEQSVQQSLGASAVLLVVDGRATVTLNKASPQALAQWLAQTRANARVVPVEARLTRTNSAVPSGAGSADASQAPLGAGLASTWDGVLVFNLPR